MKELKNPYAGEKKAVGINLSPEVMDYFKGLADETGLPYQKLIDLLSSRLRQETQKAYDEVGGIKQRFPNQIVDGSLFKDS